MEYLKKNRCCNYYMELELIWCSYENISFEEEWKRELERVFEDLQKRKEEYIIKKIAVYDDYVRLRIEVSPKYEVTNILKSVKGLPAKHILKKYPEMRQQFGKGLWDTRTAVLTQNQFMEEQINDFLKNRRTQSKIR